MLPDWYPHGAEVPDPRVHWTKIDSSPNAPAVRRHVKGLVAAAYGGRIADTTEFLRAFVGGRTVLDIGAAQHAVKAVGHAGWKHAIIAERARRVVGIDIAEEATRAAQAKGFDIRLVDATSTVDLGERFERVHMGDVLEHVDAPGALLRFADRHLAPGGSILAVTPNPFFLSYVLGGLRDGLFLPNPEHVSWITPTLALELASRVGLRLERYYHTGGVGRTPGMRAVAAVLKGLRRLDAEAFTPHFYYVFSRPV